MALKAYWSGWTDGLPERSPEPPDEPDEDALAAAELWDVREEDWFRDQDDGEEVGDGTE